MYTIDGGALWRIPRLLYLWLHVVRELRLDQVCDQILLWATGALESDFLFELASRDSIQQILILREDGLAVLGANLGISQVVIVADSQVDRRPVLRSRLILDRVAAGQDPVLSVFLLFQTLNAPLSNHRHAVLVTVVSLKRFSRLARLQDQFPLGRTHCALDADLQRRIALDRTLLTLDSAHLPARSQACRSLVGGGHPGLVRRRGVRAHLELH